VKALNEKNSTDKSAILSKLTKDSEKTQKKLNERDEKSNKLRLKAEKIIKNVSEIQHEINEITTEITQEKVKQDLIQRKHDKISRKMTSNGLSIANNMKDIHSNKDFIDKIKVEDLPNTIDKTKSLIMDFEAEIDKIMEETNQTDFEIANIKRTIQESHKNISDILSDPKIVDTTIKAKSIKSLEKIKIIFDALKKLFPIIPEGFTNNMWNYINLNHYEALNYVNAIKPSLYGLFEHTYIVNSPELLAKQRKQLKRALRRLRKL